METIDRRLARAGVLLFLLGLLTGLVVPSVVNPRMGLSAHVEGVMNGMFLVLLAFLWPHLALSARTKTVAFWLAAYGTYVNWGTVLFSAATGAGAAMMPLAGAGHTGSAAAEGIVTFGLVSLAIAMLAAAAVVLWGLRGASATPAVSEAARS